MLTILVKMFESQCGKLGTNIRKSEVNKMIKESGCELSDIGKLMLGLEDWKEI